MKFLLVLASLVGSLAQAAHINSVTYEPSTDSLQIQLTYGGCNLETFAPTVGPCMETFPMQTRLTLDDSLDNCRAIVQETITLKVEDTGLASCRPAHVSVGTSSNQLPRAHVFVPEKPQANAGLKCERDSRPVDGDYESVELVKNANNTYDVYFARITAGFGTPVENTRELIAKNLTCRFGSTDTLLSDCSKSSSAEGEATNSGFKVKHVKTTQVNGESSTYAIEVYSPLLNANFEKPGFPFTERKGWANFEFNAAPHPESFMVNRCIAN